MQDLTLFLSQQHGIHFYTILTFALIASGCYFPISSDLTIVAATTLAAATGLYNVPIIFFCSLLGIMTGDLINFTIAKKYGPVILNHSHIKKIVKPNKVEYMTHFFRKFGAAFIFVVRFMPSTRTILFFSAGLFRVSTWKFIFFNGLSTSLYLAILITLSYKIGADFKKLSSLLFEHPMVFILLAIFFILLIFYIKKKLNRPDSPPPITK
jgi:membrane protein DedA with SNARE-associated domain